MSRTEHTLIPTSADRANTQTELALNWGFLCRVALVAVFVAVTHQLKWEWLRFVTSEAILRLSTLLGLAASRASFDTINVRGAAFSFVVACTFVDVFMGSVPLVWNFRKSPLRNLARLLAAGAILFVFNVIRLEISQILYACGVPWTLADEVLGGFAYLAVWLAIWRVRSWKVFTSPP
jgi:hypothetical protein